MFTRQRLILCQLVGENYAGVVASQTRSLDGSPKASSCPDCSKLELTLRWPCRLGYSLRSSRWHDFRLPFLVDPLVRWIKPAIPPQRPLWRGTAIVFWPKCFSSFQQSEELVVVDDGVPPTIDEKPFASQQNATTMRVLRCN